MNEDNSNLINNLSNMLKNKEVPDNVQELLNSFINNSSNKNTQTDKSSNSNLHNNNSSNENLSFKNFPTDKSDLSFDSKTNEQMDNNSSNAGNRSNSPPDFDIDTILKMKRILDTVNSNSNNESANLLLSLKPYLKDSKKEKIDKYVNLLKISKLIDVFNPLGGDKKNNV